MSMRDLSLPLDRDLFFRKMIRSFAKNLEETVGLDEASGYVALVGSEIGEWIESQYIHSANKQHFEPTEIANMMVDLKRRIGGDFHVVSVDDERIVLGNHKCPFDDLAIGRPSLCRMTSNVFGRIAANQTGYARVELGDTIANGADGCVITIHLEQPGAEDEATEAHEFFRVEDEYL